jgi:hypothetical protein
MMPKYSHFPPKRMRRICRLLDVRDAEWARQLEQDLLGIRRAHLLRKAEENAYRPSEVRQELRSGIKIIGAAARWVENLSGFAQQALEEAVLSKADVMGAQWKRELPGLRRRRGLSSRKVIIDYHRDIIEGIPWLLTTIKDYETELDPDRRESTVNLAIASLLLVFEEYTGKNSAGHIICDHEGYRGVTLAVIIEVLDEIDPQHGLSTNALGARVRRIADAVRRGHEELTPTR